MSNITIPPSTLQRIRNNNLLYPIVGSYHNEFPQHYNAVRAYNRFINELKELIETSTGYNTIKLIRDDGIIYVTYEIKDVNRIDPCDSQFTTLCRDLPSTPNEAFASGKGTYYTVLTGAVSVNVKIYNKIANANMINVDSLIADQKPLIDQSFMIDSNQFLIKLPAMLGYEGCVLHHFDKSTKRRTAQDYDDIFGLFIIESKLRRLIFTFENAYNNALTLVNNYSDQIARSEALYMIEKDYANSYYVIGALLHNGKNSKHLYDMVFSLALNHPNMQSTSDINVSADTRQELINIIPIRLLFRAFGCESDLEMLKYIDPSMSDPMTMMTIRDICCYGKHHERVYDYIAKDPVIRSIYGDTKPKLNQELAKYLIGVIVLNKPRKELLQSSTSDNKELFQLYIDDVTEILNERFMTNIVSSDSFASRDVAVCTELGSQVLTLYRIGMNKNTGQNKANLQNKRVKISIQMLKEFKAFWMFRRKELSNELSKHLNSNKIPITSIVNNVNTKMIGLIHEMCMKLSGSLLNSFRGGGGERARMKTDIIKLKNQTSVNYQRNEIIISMSSSARNAQLGWNNRTIRTCNMFFLCPSQTPEAGAQVGRYRQPTMYCVFSLRTPGDKERELITSYKGFVKDIRTVDSTKHYTIRINYTVIGYCEQYESVEGLYRLLLEKRRSGELDRETTFAINNVLGVLSIYTDTGRMLVPMVVIENAFTIKDDKVSVVKGFREWLQDGAPIVIGFKKGYIEYICPEMAQNGCVIAESVEQFNLSVKHNFELMKSPNDYEPLTQYTHIALPGSVHGVVAGMISYIGHQTGTRAAYLTNHTKQGIGVTIPYPQAIYPTEIANFAIQPEVPLVVPYSFKALGLHNHPTGNNVPLVVIMYRSNQEDCCIVNREYIDRGLLSIDALMTFNKAIIAGSGESFNFPTNIDDNVILHGNQSGYKQLNKTTCMPNDVGVTINTDDPVIAVTRESSVNDGQGTKIVSDGSMICKKITHPNLFNTRSLSTAILQKYHENNKSYKAITTHQFRHLIGGDKVASQYAQKGTIVIMDPEQLPYNEFGQRAALYFNGGSILKRKTFGQLTSIQAQTIAAILGCPLEATSFNTTYSHEELTFMLSDKILGDMGLDRAGTQVYYDPDTGEPVQSRLYYGMGFWERQPHFVEEKLNVRNGGPTTADTNIPTKGKRRGGGAALDRMSTDSIRASGATDILLDTILHQCSNMTIAICNECHTTNTFKDKFTQKWTCQRCGITGNFTLAKVPPATNLITHILRTSGVTTEIYPNINK